MEHLTLLVPAPGMALVVAPFGVGYAMLVGVIASRFRLRRAVRVPYTRKLFHFGIFTMAAVVQWIWGPAGVIVFGSAVAGVVLHAVWRGDGHPLYEALARPTDAPHRTLFILVPLATTALGGLLANLLFARFAYVGYLVCGWGDAAGEPVGTRWGAHRYRVPSLAGTCVARSLEGSAGVLVVGTVAAFLGLLAAGFDAGAAAGIAIAAGGAGAITEAVSTHGLDNLTVQLAAAGVAFLLAG